MPNRISLETVKAKLPAFVQIEPSSYRGMRYPAQFTDTDYGEPFVAIVAAVITHQHGCKSRSNARRSKPYGKRITLEQFKARLPAYLTIYPETWKGLRHKARFRDSEYAQDFEAYACNVLRTGKGYCKARELAAFRLAVCIPASEIQNRLDTCYGTGYARLIPESYVNTNEVATFAVTGRGLVRYAIQLACKGGLDSTRCKQLNWRAAVMERDKGRCAISGETLDLHAHHIRSKADCPELRFEPSNGIALASRLHREFHSLYGKTGTNAQQLLAFARSKGIRLEERLRIG